MGDYFVDIDNFKVRETPTNPTFSMDKSSMSGKLILSAKYEGRVDVSAIPSGSYLVRIATQYGFVLRKVQIVR
jgi:hypothetical protein